MAIEKELLDQLLAGRDPNEVFARDGLLDDLKKALSERILNAELDEHLDEKRSDGNANRRNGHSRKSVLTGTFADSDSNQFRVWTHERTTKFGLIALSAVQRT
jgi:hypothetical protein